MKDKKAFYNQEFSNVLEYCKNNYLFLGEGTPSADILIIGKECGSIAPKHPQKSI